MSVHFWNIKPTEEENLGNFAMNSEMEPIPSKTLCLAFIEEAKWDDYEGEEYISLRWKVLQPAEYKNRVIFQKIKVYDKDDKKADKAKRMLLAIDFNAKGGLASSGKIPTTEMLQSKLCNKPMSIMVMVWSMENSQTGEMKKGNWISAVSPKNADQPTRVVPVAVETVSMPDEDEVEMPF